MTSKSLVSKKRRLHIGGLFPQISEDDLRQKFGSFGSISDIQIMRKKDTTGGILKTFAYMDIDGSESYYNKCVNTFNKSRWKGYQMSVQIAKESFLTKLKKERAVDNQKSEEIQIKDTPALNKSFDDIAKKVENTKNIPGTKVPGEDKWVIGKFGVVHPIVNIKDKRKRKGVKHDPSTHCHRIKRFKDNVAEDFAVSDIKWEEEVQQLKEGNVKRDDLSKVQHEISTDSSSESESEPAESKRKENKKEQETIQKSRDRSKNEKNRSNKEGTKKECIKDMVEDNLIVHKSLRSSLDTHGRNDTLIKKNLNFKSEKQNVLSSNGGNDCQELDNNLNPNQQLTISIIEQIRQRKKCDTTPKDGKPMDLSEGHRTIDNTDNGVTGRENFTNSTLNGIQSPDFDSPRLQDKHFEENSDGSLGHLSENEDHSPNNNTLASRTDKDDSRKQPCTNLNRKHTTNRKSGKQCEERASISEQKRQDSLKKHINAIQKQQDIIKSSLDKIDHHNRNEQHIMFSDDSDSDSGIARNKNALSPCSPSKGKVKHLTASGKISGKASLSWLGLDKEKEEDTEGDEEDDILPTKSYFEGRTGLKLLKLQQAIGPDDRFKLDEKFLESDSDLEEGDNSKVDNKSLEDEEGSSDGESNSDHGMKDERNRNLKILQQILGTKTSTTTVSKKPRTTNSGGPIRFDPTDESHRQFEVKEHLHTETQEARKTEKKVEKSNPDDEMAGKENTEEIPSVDTERYYNVSSSLKSLFGDTGSKGFSFLGQSNDSEDEADQAEHDSLSLPLSHLNEEKQNSLLNREIDSPLSDMADDSNNVHEEDHSPFKLGKKPRFFFTADDERLGEQTAIFMRTETQEEIESYWNSVRKRYTEDYKRKHKDAVRWKKKMMAKQNKRT